MTDEEFLFRQTSIERKKIGRGDYSKKRRGGRNVRLPSDHITQKEWKKMNGEVKSYRLNEPVGWEEFKVWPKDIQREYIQTQVDKFGVGTPELAQMLGISAYTLSDLRRELGIPGKRGGKRKPVGEEWLAFVGEEPPENQVCPPGSGVNNLAVLLESLRGTGAKIVIEFTL